MCLAVPAEVVALTGSGSALVRFGSIEMEIRTDLLPEVRPGEYVVVHAGFAIAILEEGEALERYDMLSEILGEENGE